MPVSGADNSVTFAVKLSNVYTHYSRGKQLELVFGSEKVSDQGHILPRSATGFLCFVLYITCPCVHVLICI